MSTERVTDVVAGGSLTAFWWYPILRDVSELAATVIPLFALIWLVVQIVNKLANW